MDFEYEIFLGEDVITVFYGDESSTDISLSKFWAWVKHYELNEWVHNYFNPAEPDGHRQDTGFHSFEEYFALPYQKLKADIEAYLLKRKKTD